MAINMFETRTMLQLMEQMLPVRTFFRDTFFSDTEPSESQKVDIDIIKGARRLAPFVNPKKGSKTVARKGFTTYTYEPPMIAPNTVTHAQEFLSRQAGETIYGGMSPTERGAIQLGRDMRYLDELITRREEVMCVQSILTGKVTVIGDDVEDEIDFGQELNDSVEEGQEWNGDGDPIETLKEMKAAILEKSGVNPDIAIFGADAMKAFLSNPKVKEKFDITRITLGQINPQEVPNGATYYGYLNEIGDIYTYQEWYLDDDGVSQPLIPKDTVMLGSTRARTFIAYGAVVFFDDKENPFTYVGPRIPRSWTQKNPSARFVELNSRPLPVPQQIDAFYVKKVVLP